MNYP